MTRNLVWLVLCFSCSVTTALVVRHWDSLTVLAQDCVAVEDCEDCVPSVSDGQGGWAPLPIENGDIDANGEINLTDAVYLLNHLFMGGPEPPEIECVKCLAPPGDKACIRFLNELLCAGNPFSAELDVCGTKLTSVSGELSDCICIDPVEACEVCVTADGGTCGPIQGCAVPQSLEAGKVYTFILGLGGDGPSLGFIDQVGDCDTPLPEPQGAEAKRLGAEQPILVLESVEGLETR